MHVAQLFTYPVKSMQGIPTTSAVLGERGLVGDRRAALRDVATGVVLTGRRDPALLLASTATTASGEVEVVLPDGTRTADNAVLSAWIGRPVELVTARPEPSTYEINIDPEDDDSPVTTWQGPGGSFHDSTRIQVSLVATGALGDWDVRRFRPNVLVDADSIDHLVGATVRLGSAEVQVVKPIDRCVMITRPQAGGIEADREVLRTVARERGNILGIGGLVRRTGSTSVGDQLVVTTPT